MLEDSGVYVNKKKMFYWEIFLILIGVPYLDQEPSKGDVIGSIKVYFDQHKPESQESITLYMFIAL